MQALQSLLVALVTRTSVSFGKDWDKNVFRDTIVWGLWHPSFGAINCGRSSTYSGVPLTCCTAW